MDRTVFFDSVRRALGSLNQKQVEGLNRILDYAERRSTYIKFLASILAQCKVETRDFQPVRETFAETDAQAISRLETAWATGKLPWVKTPYWRPDADGEAWFGRGLIQVTHKANYLKFGIKNPDDALQWDVALLVMFDGMEKGMFTGVKLGDYLSLTKSDYLNARRVVNSLDRAAEVEHLSLTFERALQASGYGTVPDIEIPSAPVPPPVSTKPSIQAVGIGIMAAVGVLIAGLLTHCGGN